MCVCAFYHTNWINQIIRTYLPDFSNPGISQSPTVLARFYPGAVGDAVSVAVPFSRHHDPAHPLCLLSARPSVYILFKRDLPAQILPVCFAVSMLPSERFLLPFIVTVRMEGSEHFATLRALAFHLAVSGGWNWVVRLGSKSLFTHELSHRPRSALLLFFFKAFCSFGLTVAVGKPHQDYG